MSSPISEYTSLLIPFGFANFDFVPGLVFAARIFAASSAAVEAAGAFTPRMLATSLIFRRARLCYLLSTNKLHEQIIFFRMLQYFCNQFSRRRCGVFVCGCVVWVCVLLCTRPWRSVRTQQRSGHSLQKKLKLTRSLIYRSPFSDLMSQFWQPAPNAQYDRGENHSLLINNSNKHLPLASQRRELPIFGIRTQILYAVEKYRTIVLVGETGQKILFIRSVKLMQFIDQARENRHKFHSICQKLVGLRMVDALYVHSPDE